jgi:DNA-binding NarL/FixJ family response regulator
LRRCARAIVHLHAPHLVPETPLAAYAAVKRMGNFDALVCAYRAFPELANDLASHGSIRGDIAMLLARANDDALSVRLGLANLGPTRERFLLSPREREVLRLLCDGLSNRQIADALFLSIATVKVHLRHIYEKLGVSNRTQAILRSRQD